MTRRYAMLVKEKKPSKFQKGRKKEQRKEHTRTRPPQWSHTPSQHHLAANTSKYLMKENYSNAGCTYTKIICYYFCVSHKKVSLTESQIEVLQLTHLHSLKAFFLNSKLFFLPSQKKTSSRQHWAHASSYSTLKSKVYAWQLLSWNFPEALPALLPRKAKPSQCLFELNLRF